MDDLRSIEEILREIDDVLFSLEEELEFDTPEHDAATDLLADLDAELEYVSWHVLQFAEEEAA